MTWTIRAVVGAALLLSLAGEARTVEITSAAFDRGGIDPSDVDFASDVLRVSFTTGDAGVAARITLEGGGQDRTLAEPASITSPYALTVTDTTGGPALPDGEYTVRVALTDTEGTADTTLVFAVDQTPPVFHSLEITGPEGSFANGDYIPLRAVLDEPASDFTLDVSSIDDAGDGRAVLVEAQDDTTYGLLYRISPLNEVEDDNGLPFTVIATDRFGNSQESEEVRICLSSYPPLFETGHLVTAVLGDTLPDDHAFTSGDVVRLRTTWQTRFGNPLGPEQAIGFRVDLSDLDTTYEPLVNEAVLDTAFAESLGTGEALDPDYVYRIHAFHSYELSELNRNPEGFYDGLVIARDQGCGETETEPAFRIRLADLGPPAPTIDPPPSTIVTGERVPLSGTAPEAVGVRFALQDGPDLVEAALDTLSGRFSAEVPLQSGRNVIVAISDDGLDHDSDPSDPVEIFRIDDATLEVGPRVRPGDSFEVALLEPADRVDVDVFSLAGDRVWHATTTSRDAVLVFVWDGRTTRGELAQSGPYIARATIHAPSGKRALNEAFVFTRK